MWNLFISTISHGRTIVYIMVSAIEASNKAVGCSLKIFDPGKCKNVGDLETVEFADVLGVIAEDFRLTRCVQVCFAETEENRAEQHENRSTMSREIKTRNKGNTSWKKLTKRVDLLEQKPRPKSSRVRDRSLSILDFVFLAEPALQSDNHMVLATSIPRGTRVDATC